MKNEIIKNSCLILLGYIMFSCSSKKPEDKSIRLEDYAIAYNVLADRESGNYEVFTMNTDGTEKKNITNLSGVEWTYYSFQDKLYFISDKNTCQRCGYFLYETNFRGENPRKIPGIVLADSWMSSRNNGNELIIRPHPRIDSVFYIINLNGEILEKINPGKVYFNDPMFSPDGEKIVFRGADKKFKRDNGYIDELYLINTDGTGLIQLTHYPETDTTAQWYNYHAGPPKWHPTENFISYMSIQEGKSSLFAVTPDGSKQWKLTGLKQNEGWHDWSPDGKWLVIEVFNEEENQFDVALMNWKTKELSILTDTTYHYQQAPNFVLKTSN